MTNGVVSAIIIKSSRGDRARKVSLLAQHWEAMKELSGGSKKSYHKKLFEKVLTKGLRSDIILKLSKGEASGEKFPKRNFEKGLDKPNGK